MKKACDHIMKETEENDPMINNNFGGNATRMLQPGVPPVDAAFMMRNEAVAAESQPHSNGRMKNSSLSATSRFQHGMIPHLRFPPSVSKDAVLLIQPQESRTQPNVLPAETALGYAQW